MIHQGVHLPESEQHMVEWMTKNGEIVDGKGTYQIKKLRKAISYCKQFRTAVDIGAHVGLWTMQLAKTFNSVYAFEPVKEHQDCFNRNVSCAGTHMQPGECWIMLHECALGSHDGLVTMKTPEEHSSGSTMIDVAKDGDIPLRTLDSFKLTNVDFIKLDCEGYELFALQGGVGTIERDRPVIIVEQKPGRAQRFKLPETGAVDFLREVFGYRLETVLAGDYIMVSEPA